MKDFSTFLLILLFSFLFNSCHLDELEFDRLSRDANWNPQVVAPLAKGNITVWDLINDDNKASLGSLSKGANGLIQIVYQKNNLFTYNVRDLIKFPVTRHFTSGDQMLGNISPEDVIISRAISLEELAGKTNGAMNGIVLLNGMTFPFPPLSASNLSAQFTLDDIADFTTVTLSEGTLNIMLNNNLAVPVTIHGNLFDITNNSVVAEFTFTDILPGTSKSQFFNMAGKNLSNKVEFQLLSFETPGSLTPVQLDLQDSFRVIFHMTDLGISKGHVKIVKAQALEGAKGNFEFDFPEPDVKAFSGTLKKGSLIIKTVNNLPLSGTVNLFIPEIKNKTTGAPVAASVPMDGTPITIPLDNAAINFSADPEKPFNRIPYTYTVTIIQSGGFVNYSSTDAVKLDISLDHLEFQSITGDFGQRSVPIDSEQFALDVELLNMLNGDFSLANPSLMFTIRNAMGIPSTMAIELEATTKDGSSVSMDRPAIEMALPENMNAGVATQNVVFDKQNSNIINFIAVLPSSEVSYKGTLNLNSQGPVSAAKPNFLDLDAVFGIDMSLELPLELQVSKLGFKDTTAIEGSDYQKIENAELILNVNNEIPLDIEMQLLFVDTLSGQQFGASKVTKILSAAQINEVGAITPVQSSHTFSLDKAEMENLVKANGLVFSGFITSPASGTTVAPVYSNSKMEISVVVKSKLNL